MKTEATVGMFFLIGIGLVVTSVLTWRPSPGRGEFAVPFASVDGLQPNDAVTYNGVRVGRVSSVEPTVIDGRPQVLVRFAIESGMRPAVLVGERTTVQIVKEMIGPASLRIVSAEGAPITPELARALRGQAPVGLAEALGSVQSLVEDNRAEIARAIKSVGAALDRFGAMSEELNGILAENRPGIRSAIDGVGGAAGALRDAIRDNRSSIDAAIAGIRDAATQAYRAIHENRGQLKEAIDHLPTLIGAMTRAADEIEMAVRENRQDLKTALANVAAFSQRLDAIGADIQKVTAQLASRQGSLSRFIFEDTAHDKATTALDSLQARLEEVKPVTRGFSDLRFYGGLDAGMNARTGADQADVWLRVQPKPWKFYEFGIGYRGAPGDRDTQPDNPDELGVDFNLKLGWRFFPDDDAQRYGLTVIGGLFDSKPGAQVSTPLGDWLSFNAMVRKADSDRPADDRRFEDSSVVVRSWLEATLWDRVGLRLGYDDLAGRPGPYVGIGVQIEDNDLRNLLLGSSFLP